MKIRRAYLIEPGRFEVREEDINPTDDQLIVKVSVCGLCNWELNHFKGLLGTCPMALGHEWAGIVVWTGKNTKKFAIGDAVTGYGSGGFADYITVFEKDCYKLSKNVDPKYALGEPLKCIVTVLRAAAPEAGDYGVVLGCGPMGLWCIQVLANNLLGALIAIDVDDKKLTLARRFGATHIINSKRENVIQKIANITNGNMADFLIEGTGKPALIGTSMSYMKTGRGRLIVMSSHKDAAGEFDFREAIEKGLEIRVAHPAYSLNQYDDMRRAVQLINNGTFKVEETISHTFRLDEIQTAFEILDNKPKNYIKGIVIP
ncbi:MAG TPA: zinc-binding dehydrogenase [Clostridiaceae bacterium]|nr:zinc-binding dehydrogenase [Clostridiaceae bacterium]